MGVIRVKLVNIYLLFTWSVIEIYLFFLIKIKLSPYTSHLIYRINYIRFVFGQRVHEFWPRTASTTDL